MNPYQHSDIAVEIYKFLCEDEMTSPGEQGALGSLACRLANLINDKFGLELQPAEEDRS